MTYPQTMGYIILPQAFRNMVPVLLTQTIILFQDTSLVYVLSITDFLGAASKVAHSATGAWSRCICSPPLVYFVISFAASQGVRWLQRRDRHRPLARVAEQRESFRIEHAQNP